MKARKIADGLALLTVTAWAGIMWGVGYLAVPVLFQMLPDRMLAGELAGRMFALVAIVSLICAAIMLIYYLWIDGRNAMRRTNFFLVVAMLVLTLVSQFGLQPAMAELKAQAYPATVMSSPLAGQFSMLHGISSLCYLVQSLLGGLLVLCSRTQAHSSAPQT